MADSILRIVSVLLVMLVAGLISYWIALSRLKRKGVDSGDAGPTAARHAKRYSLIAAFVYMVAMVSVAGLFM